MLKHRNYPLDAFVSCRELVNDGFMLEQKWWDDLLQVTTTVLAWIFLQSSWWLNAANITMDIAC